MKKIVAVLLLLPTCIVSAVRAQDLVKIAPDTPKTLDIGSDRLILYKDIRYGGVPAGIAPGESSDRLLDLYVPTSAPPAGGYPVFLFIHGGGFTGGDKGSKNGYDHVCKEMAERGYAVVSMNYYLTLKHEREPGVSCTMDTKKGLPASGEFHPLVQRAVRNASDDAQLALKWIADNARKHNLDTARVAVCGGSAGGMTMLYLVYMSGQDVLPIVAAVNFWGAIENPDAIHSPAVPLLTYHGDQDAVILVDYAHAIHARMDRIGNTRSAVHILEGKGHALYSYIAGNRIDEIDRFLKSIP